MRIHNQSLIAVLAAVVAANALAVDAYDPTTNLLTMESVVVGGQTYRNVAVTVDAYSQLSVSGGDPGISSFDATSGFLTLGSVATAAATYANARLHVDRYSLLSVAGPATVDTLATSNYSGVLASYLANLNAYRTQCGLPALQPNTRLEAAITQKLNIGGRAQSAASTAGYAAPSTVGMVAGDYLGSSTEVTTIGRSELLLALAEPYALLSLMRPYTEVGLTLTFATADGKPKYTTKAMLGNPMSRGISAPLTFPCANTVDAPPTVAATSVGRITEIAAPAVSPQGFGWYAVDNGVDTGTPIAVFAQPGDNLVLRSASVAAAGVVVNSMLWDSTRSVGTFKGLFLPVTEKPLYSYEGLVLPLAPLAANTNYDVTITGTVNGVLFSKSFRFKTGTKPQ